MGDFTWKNLTDQDMEMVIKEAINNNQCKVLGLGGNKITSIGASILANALNNNNTLEELYIWNNHISDDGVLSFAKMLTMNNRTLKVLDIGSNQISDEGVKYLVEMLKTNQTLTQLNLEGNEISDEGVRLLANVIENGNTIIEYLDLCSNKLLTDLSIDYLIQMVKNNRSLTYLHLRDCNWSETAKRKLETVCDLKKKFCIGI